MLFINQKKCIGCGVCQKKCPTGAIKVNKNTGLAVIDKDKCINCGLCLQNCPQKAIWDIKGEFTIALGTDDQKTIKSKEHVGMSEYFQIWQYWPEKNKLEFVENRPNKKYQESQETVHGDPGKAEATATALKGVDILIGKMIGPNVKRLKFKFIPVVVRETAIKQALEIIKNNFAEIFEAQQKPGELRRGLVLI